MEAQFGRICINAALHEPPVKDQSSTAAKYGYLKLELRGGYDKV